MLNSQQTVFSEIKKCDRGVNALFVRRSLAYSSFFSLFFVLPLVFFVFDFFCGVVLFGFYEFCNGYIFSAKLLQQEEMAEWAAALCKLDTRDKNSLLNLRKNIQVRTFYLKIYKLESFNPK